MLEKLLSPCTRIASVAVVAGSLLASAPAYAEHSYFSLPIVLPSTVLPSLTLNISHVSDSDKGPCPPYICPNEDQPAPLPGSSPSRGSPQEEQRSPESAREKSGSDYAVGATCILFGALGMVLGRQKARICTGYGGENCSEGIPPEGHAAFVGGILLTGAGLYYLFR